MASSIQIENQEPLTVFLEGGTKAKLREIGRRDGQSSMSALVRKALIDYIRLKEQEVKRDATE